MNFTASIYMLFPFLQAMVFTVLDFGSLLSFFRFSILHILSSKVDMFLRMVSDYTIVVSLSIAMSECERYSLLHEGFSWNIVLNNDFTGRVS